MQNFYSKFDDLMNNKVLVDKFIERYEQAALNHKSNNVMEYNVEYIEKCCNELKLNKVGDFDNLSIEQVSIFGHSIITMHLKKLLAFIIKRDHVHVDIKRDVISPVIKDKSKGFNDVTNYRPVPIISVQQAV